MVLIVSAALPRCWLRAAIPASARHPISCAPMHAGLSPAAQPKNQHGYTGPFSCQLAQRVQQEKFCLFQEALHHRMPSELLQMTHAHQHSNALLQNDSAKHQQSPSASAGEAASWVKLCFIPYADRRNERN